MCWESVKEWAQVLESLAVIGGTGFAVLYAQSWRKEQLNERQLDLASDLLGRMLLLRESAKELSLAIMRLRKSGGGHGDLSTESIKREDASYIGSCVKALKKALDEVLLHRVRATVLFGNEVASAFGSLSFSARSCFNDMDRLQVQIRLYARFLQRL